MTEKIGIFGGGVLGQAMKGFFGEVKIFDKYNQADELVDVLEQDLFFICVPTPYIEGRGFDLTEVNDVFDKLSQLENKTVVIRSTVLPGTTSEYQTKYPNLKVLFNPEFLTEATANEDFLKPDKQIVGYTEKSKDVAEEVLNILPKATFQKVIPASEAEMIKYMVNNFYSLKVIFANQIYDLCQAAGLDYELVKEGFIADKRIVDSHLDIFHKGYRGYGGKCLKKDTNSLIDFAKQNGFDLEIMKTARKINNQLNEDK